MRDSGFIEGLVFVLVLVALAAYMVIRGMGCGRFNEVIGW